MKVETATPRTVAEAEADLRSRLRMEVVNEVLDERIRQETMGFDSEQDDLKPIYAWARDIDNQLRKPQSGKGPWRKRFLRIAALAIAAVESTDRKAEDHDAQG